MKLILSLLIFFSILAGGVWFLVGTRTSGAEVTQVLNDASEKIVLPTEKPQPGNPVRLVINALDVDAAVESVGMDERGRMDVPKKDENVAWYNLGYKPGANGSAVIAGHLDTRSGTPAVFYNIGKLKLGDRIQVIDDKEQVFTYSVVRTESYDYDKVPLQEIFATKGKARLNLITCEGAFDSASQNYSKRLVVYAEEAEE